jgi:hypothetical protein
MVELQTAADVIRQLGGTSKFGREWGRALRQPPVDRRVVDSWRTRGFPASLFFEMSNWLRSQHHLDVTPAAWGQLMGSIRSQDCSDL